jgi:hypothetical protein
VTKALLSKGIQFDQKGLPVAPAIECPHYGRLRLLNENINNVQRCYHLYQTMPRDMLTMPEKSALYALSVGLEGYLQADLLLKCLATTRDKCMVCKQVHQMKRVEQDKEIQEEQEEDEWEEKRQNDSNNSQEEYLAGPKNDHNFTVLPGYLAWNKIKKKLMAGSRRRVPATIRAPTTKGGEAIQLKPQRFQMLQRNKLQDFDNYYGGPTLEDMMELQRPGGLEAYPNDWDVAPTIRSPWELFKNYGFTLEPEFVLMFNRQEPFMAREHLLPVGESDPPPSDVDEEEPRCEELWMEEMLALAPMEGTLDSMNMFVQGVMPDGTLIKLNPTRNLYPLRLDEYFFSLDIDSINWVTYEL